MAAQSLGTRIKSAWNAFRNKDPTSPMSAMTGMGYYSRPDRIQLNSNSERTIINTVINKIAVDAASKKIRHVRTDENGRFVEEMDSRLNYCLSVRTNKDQTSRAFIQDVVTSMLDEGVCAIVPVDTDGDPALTDSYEIHTMRVGKVVEWRPDWVKIRGYDDEQGIYGERWFEKRLVAIVENPFYSIMNEPNSTLRRLARKITLLDRTDEDNNNGKFNMVIKLPYAIKSKARKAEADLHRQELETQLKTSEYGIGYIDAAEQIIQLNRPLESSLATQVDTLTNELYTQLGITPEILNGTADENTMTNYYSRVVGVILSTITEEMYSKFLSKTARTQHQSIMFFDDPFKLMPVNEIAEIADKFTRNEILTTNEFRQIIGMKPADDPRADQLINKNINHPDEATGNKSASSDVDIEDKINSALKKHDKQTTK